MPSVVQARFRIHPLRYGLQSQHKEQNHGEIQWRRTPRRQGRRWPPRRQKRTRRRLAEQDRQRLRPWSHQRPATAKWRAQELKDVGRAARAARPAPRRVRERRWKPPADSSSSAILTITPTASGVRSDNGKSAVAERLDADALRSAALSVPPGALVRTAELLEQELAGNQRLKPLLAPTHTEIWPGT